jgi:tRNA(fMet)-specific endonuclease VapC
MDPAILDTDIFSEVLRQRNAAVVQKAAAYVQQHGQIAISSVSRFEILRGYKKENATTQLGRFHVLCQKSLVLALTDAIFDRAADLWAYGRNHGHPVGDADVLIAATALEHGRTLVTGNEPHFTWMPGLVVDNWRQ